MKIKGKWPLLFLALLWVLTGCQDDDIWVNTENDDDNRELEIAAPIGEITYKIADFLEEIDNEYIFVDQEGMVYARFFQEVDIDWETLVRLRDFSEVWKYPLNEVDLFPGLKAASSAQFKEKVKLNSRDDVRIDSAFMDEGRLQFQLSVPFGTTGNVQISVPEVFHNGEPLHYSFEVNASNYTFWVDEDLAGKKIVPSQGQDSSYLSVITSVDLENVVIGNVFLDFSLSNMNPALIFGYFGQQEASKLEQDISFDVFDDLEEDVDNIEFFDLNLSLNVESGIGVPFDVTVENLQFFHENGDLIGTLNIDGENFVNLFLEPAIYSDPIENAVTSITIDRDKSDNIVDIVNSYPDRVRFDVTSVSNPYGESELQNFMGLDNVLKGTLEVNLPAWFKASGYSRKDTVDFDIHDIFGEDEDDVRKIEGITLFFDFFSRIPVDIAARIWVIDGQGNKIDDLLDSTKVIVSGDLNPETGFVEEPEHSEFSVAISGNQINEFLEKDAMNIVIETAYNTPSGDNPELDFIRIYDDMDFKGVVSIKINGSIPSL